MIVDYLVSILLLSPLLGFLINGCSWSRTSIQRASLIGSGACFISFLSAVGIFFYLLSHLNQAIVVSFFSWIHVADFNVSFSFLVDTLSVFMLLIITGVGLLIHLFSVYYMSQDRRPARYFAYLNLFIFNMMVLVLADNLLLMFVGWEGVGLCSYLLIGFWFNNINKAKAGMQAFIVNRIGDIGLLLGMIIIFFQLRSLHFNDMSFVLHSLSSTAWIPWACLCLVIGAVGKSAQIPLYIWLPPAMAGPTPVSALIHAATMVTAGVYLMCRMSFMFVLAPAMLSVISWIGGLTACLAGVIACAQTDIKKVLAYSTVSQLGYMFVAVGVGAFTSALFHLMTHAFFKALLFLTAGAIIHVLHGEQNIYRMGGLHRRFPWIWLSFLIGFLALIGLPPLSGFFSKDEILWQIFLSHQQALFVLMFLTGLLTAFYMSRLFILVFYGSAYKNDDHLSSHFTGFFAKAPLLILSVMAVIGGFLGLPHLISQYLPGHPPHFLRVFLQNALFSPSAKHSSVVAPVSEGLYQLERQELGLMITSFVFVLVIVVLTSWLYLKKQLFLQNCKRKFRAFVHALEQGLFVDRFCYTKIVEPVLQLSQELYRSLELQLIQGSIFSIQKGIISLRDMFLSWQNGKLQNYLFFMLLGLIILILSVLF